MSRPSWDELYISMCYLIAAKSRDLTTHVGAVIVGSDHTVKSVGYNSFPRGIEFEGEIGEDGLPSRQSRLNNEKYDWMEHAESNAIFNAGRSGLPIIGSTLYTNINPCTSCSRAIIQSGIKRVVIHKEGQAAYVESRCGESIEWARAENSVHPMLAECGDIIVEYYSGELMKLNGLFSGKSFY